MKRSTFAALLFLAAAAPAAWAGERVVSAVAVHTSMRFAEGSLGSARNSADSQQMLGCWVSVSTGFGATNGYCAARTASGVSGTCTTTAPEMFTQIRAISGDSHIQFFWDASGNCTSITVSNFSTYEPKVR